MSNLAHPNSPGVSAGSEGGPVGISSGGEKGAEGWERYPLAVEWSWKPRENLKTSEIPHYRFFSKWKTLCICSRVRLPPSSVMSPLLTSCSSPSAPPPPSSINQASLCLLPGKRRLRKVDGGNLLLDLDFKKLTIWIFLRECNRLKSKGFERKHEE